ncbi:phosphodiesterase/alkaline phosphatase D [Lentzea pudingi]|uniref:Phosphodiesterase/alkaline phosphatase D n=1 Tax=Lentzea pudingi TaxID=1789439 RepID=A0ABQ2HNA2_9PSEU|nr:alkaline phosphatase D family protein [Lentzea pudingi]GGM84448.1 phosphodiesterase/alkaline phosphatase D [Lentzea pudingi]
MTGVDRRTFLIATAAAAGATSVSGTASAAVPLFEHGVASGDPLPDGVLLWTRVVTSSPVEWEAPRDESFARIARRGRTTTGAHRDHTVKVEVHGLRPGTRYWYRFRVDGVLSPVGRTKTAPTDCSRVQFGVVSCANWMAGHFVPYGYLADRDKLDAVIHLGDYIYPHYDPKVRDAVPPHEIVTLQDYRTRHAMYKTDQHLQRLHATHPMIATWDDNESADNSSALGAIGHDPATEGPWAVRLAAATQAYFEWMPIREGLIFRRLRYGALADLTMLDLRSHRTPDTIMGRLQRDWLARGICDGTARWRLVGTSVMFSPLAIPPNPTFPSVNTDQWDGFPADREFVLRALERAGQKNAVFLTGDIHSSWAVDVPDAAKTKSVATEYITTSVTSDNFDEFQNVPPRTGSLQLEAGIMAYNPHVRFVELDSHGVSVLDVTAEEVRMDWFYTSNRTDPNATITKAHSWRTRHDTAKTEKVLL